VVGLRAGIQGYGELLSTGEVRRLVAWGVLARVPMGMIALALVLLIRALGGTYGEAGVATAGEAVAVALAAPVGGRLIDRYGARPVLVGYAIAYPISLAVLLIAAWGDGPIWLIGVVALLSGIVFPPIAPAARMLWPRIVGDQRQLSAAYGLEATLQEIIFILGPLVVGVLAAGINAEAAIVATAGLTFAGVMGFALSPAVGRTGARTEGHEERHLLAALAPSGVRRVIAFCAGYGLAFGAVEVAMPAFAERHGDRELAALLLAAWSAGSLVGGLLAGAHSARDPDRRLRVISLAFTAVLVLPLIAGSIPAMVAVMFLVGLPIAPSFAITYGMVERTALPGTQAEVFGWLSTSIVLGVAAGTAAGGNLITHVSVNASLLLGVAGGAVAALVAMRGARAML